MSQFGQQTTVKQMIPFDTEEMLMPFGNGPKRHKLLLAVAVCQLHLCCNTC